MQVFLARIMLSKMRQIAPPGFLMSLAQVLACIQLDFGLRAIAGIATALDIAAQT
jgi:hypothetical protein